MGLKRDCFSEELQWEVCMPFSANEGYGRCLSKAIDRTQALLVHEPEVPEEGQIHAVKSILYAAIERAGMESERFLSAQELLRELLALIVLRGDPIAGEREEALRIVCELKSHCAMEE